MDRRIKYTKSIIKETFINLLEQKDINKITVSEICKTADINRSTFYRYYLDVYDLLSKIQDELIEKLKNIKADKKYTVESFSEEILNIFLEEKKLIKILFDTNENIYFLNTILEVAYQKCKETWLEENVELNEEEIEYASVFIFNGALGIVNYWVKNNFDKPVKEIVETINILSNYGTNKYIYKKVINN